MAKEISYRTTIKWMYQLQHEETIHDLDKQITWKSDYTKTVITKVAPSTNFKRKTKY